MEYAGKDAEVSSFIRQFFSTVECLIIGHNIMLKIHWDYLSFFKVVECFLEIVQK